MNVDTGTFQALTAETAMLRLRATRGRHRAPRKRQPRAYQPPAHLRFWEAGYDVAMYEVGTLITDLRQAGAGRPDVLAAVGEMVVARMETGLPEDGWFAGDGHP